MLSETRPSKVGTWTDSALRVLRERYLLRNAQGEVIETPEEMCWRVAQSIAAGEARYGRSAAAVHEVATAFYETMVDGYFVPNSPTLMNAGKGNGLQYSACYVLPVGDSMEEIFDSVKAAAIIHKSGGGTGFAFSRLRPKDDIVASTRGRASGPPVIACPPNGQTAATERARSVRHAAIGECPFDGQRPRRLSRARTGTGRAPAAHCTRRRGAPDHASAPAAERTTAVRRADSCRRAGRTSGVSAPHRAAEAGGSRTPQPARSRDRAPAGGRRGGRGWSRAARPPGSSGSRRGR